MAVGVAVGVGVATASTVNARVAGVASRLPAASVARTENVYAPSVVVVYACGEVQVAYVPAPAGVSSLHSNVDPASVAVNVNDGVGCGDAARRAAGDRRVRRGRVDRERPRRGRRVDVARVSVARTENVYAPSASGPTTRGDVQLTNVPVVAPGPSSLHSNVDPASSR